MEISNICPDQWAWLRRKLRKVASAIQVNTQQNIQRLASTSIAEALLIVSNLQLAWLGSQRWIVSALGFNSIYFNKLLVMINGRFVYSPPFTGVFWDVHNLLPERGKFQADLTRRLDSLSVTQYYKRAPVNYLMDVRLAGHYKNKLEVSSVVQNLLKHRHIEFAGIKIASSFYGGATWRY